jgi:adenylate kinase
VNRELSKPKQHKQNSEIGSCKVLIITGTPGAGKSTVSRKLAQRISAKLISIGELVKKERLYTREDKKRDTLVADLSRVSERVKQVIASSTGNVLVEGHYAVDVVHPSWVHRVFVLRRDPEELTKILRKRGYREDKVKENLAAEILDVCLYDAVERCGVKKVCEVNVTGRNTADVAEEIEEILNSEKKCQVGLVDWLGKLNSEGNLDKYLLDF